MGCGEKNSKDAYDFSKGCFEILSGENFSKTLFTRSENLQIEYYENRIDTLEIEWKNRFHYILKIKHPKTDLDRKAIDVKITKILSGGYEFTARIGDSRFEQKSTAKKIDSLPCF